MIAIHSDDLTNLRTFELGPELLLDAGMGDPKPGPGRPPNWQPIFWPPHIKRQQVEFSVANNELSHAQLIKYGEQISEVREKLKQSALAKAALAK